MRMIFVIHQSIIIFLIGLSWSIFLVACTEQNQSNSLQLERPELNPEQIQQVVNDITLIVGLQLQKGELQWDEHAFKIVELGKKAAPFLVEKITDKSPSKVMEFFHYKIGDIALVLLDDIYQPPSWPFPDNSVQIPIKYGDYRGDFRDYVYFINSEGARERLKESWKSYIRTH